VNNKLLVGWLCFSAICLEEFMRDENEFAAAAFSIFYLRSRKFNNFQQTRKSSKPSLSPSAPIASLAPFLFPSTVR
jgi:hypothetical protein